MTEKEKKKLYAKLKRARQKRKNMASVKKKVTAEPSKLSVDELKEKYGLTKKNKAPVSPEESSEESSSMASEDDLPMLDLYGEEREKELKVEKPHLPLEKIQHIIKDEWMRMDVDDK